VKDQPFFLTVQEVLDFHADQIQEFGGSEGLRDEGGLDSAVAQAQATFDGEYLHKGVFEMAAAYAFHIAENQPFLDGNKRTALNAAIAFLGLNGFDVIDPDGKLFSAMIGLSSGEWTKLQMAALLEQLASPWKDHD
jgi:death on curing protein